MNPVLIVQAGMMVADLVSEVADIAARYRTLVGAAQAEGRDLTQAELDSLAQARRDAVARWTAAGTS